MSRPFPDFEPHDAFVSRHIGTSGADQQRMLAALGHSSRAELIAAALPPAIRRHQSLRLPEAKPENAALAELAALAAQNRVCKSFIGQGYYGTYMPAVVRRNVLENPAWYTAYTPYQPEISQGRLEARLNGPTMVANLPGLAIANASRLDEATAAAEAMTLARRAGNSRSSVIYVASDVLPQTRAVIETRARPLGIEVRTDTGDEALENDSFAVVLQYPGANGEVRDWCEWVARYRARGGIVIVAADLLALTLLIPPGEWGADIVVGTTQRFGVPMSFGGPHAGYLATRNEFKRSMPGRLVGVTVDAQGQPAYRLALQTREQHIRREKATSNICTAQVLLAVLASMYAVYHGPQGLTTIAERTHRLTAMLAGGLRQLGCSIENAHFFDTLKVATQSETARIRAAAQAAGINLRRIDASHIGISLDETTTRSDIALLLTIFAGKDRAAPGLAELEAVHNGLPPTLRRTSAFLTAPVFHQHHCETAMLRYLSRLAGKDIALDRAMIPLGSCTMKLSATSEMLPVSWPEFAALHPFAPREQAAGYLQMIDQLETMLGEITGYAGVSLQPNAGSQGEYAGLLIIRAWHASRGEPDRNICLIPSSAHGTNPASAHMAGLEVVVVACDEQGNVDLADLKAQAERHGDRLAAIMLTYPSTHGVFEPQVREICEIVHVHGGQVYIDGANMNALVGLGAPGEFGGDVSHLNLHKTFAIPHGGGGPGVGPVAVAAHLLPFLPGHEQGIGAISAAPFGSAGILPISWLYLTMMGADGLTEASESAILAANYVARQLNPHYPVLYTGPGGLVAHECILDLRPLKETSGITAEDVAKRLIDYGFHAPTLSFPVPGTLMIEPTESEPLAELDRFIEAMIAIRAEISAIEAGRSDRDDNPLKHAPHTAEVVAADEWPHHYRRETAAYPIEGLRRNKYWPPVGRIDNVYGDRHLFCRCLPPEEPA